MNLQKNGRWFVLILALLGATSARADMDCFPERSQDGKVYDVCKTADGDLLCYACRLGESGCAPTPCPPDVN